ncbi:MAG: hypothetical protein HY817_03730 [Candidatus Abawacabacteria bacterium]|nr:hypothetical protein [Candidatus Abawacabacteria bacterium]
MSPAKLAKVEGKRGNILALVLASIFGMSGAATQDTLRAERTSILADRGDVAKQTQLEAFDVAEEVRRRASEAFAKMGNTPPQA